MHKELDKDEVLIRVRAGDYERLSAETKESLIAYSSRAWATGEEICFVVGASRVAELSELANQIVSWKVSGEIIRDK